MGAEEHDIVARVTHGGRACSTGALAAHLQRACGHVLVDARVIQQGYRFHPELGDEIPAFFNRRLTGGPVNLAVTLQAGVDATLEQGTAGWAIDPFATCRTTADARSVVESDGFHASLWWARLTIGVELVDVEQLSEPLFIARKPIEFRMLADELVSLGVLQRDACPLCSDDG